MRYQSSDAALGVLASALGSTVSRVSRVHYELAGTLDESAGALELMFEGGATVNFDSGPDGETLLVLSEGWVDPFVEPLSEENLEFVSRSGKWTKVDKSASSGFGHLVGSVFRDYSAHVLDDGRLTGVTMRFDELGLVRVECGADELIVDVAG